MRGALETLHLCAKKAKSKIRPYLRAPKKMPKKAPVTQHERAGLTFPVARIKKRMRNAKVSKKLSPMCAVYAAGVAETLMARVLRDAAENAVKRTHGKNMEKVDTKSLPHRMNLVDLVAAVRQDPDVARTFAGFSFSSGNDCPKATKHIYPADVLKANRERDRVNKANRKKAMLKKREDKAKAKAAAAAAAQ